MKIGLSVGPRGSRQTQEDDFRMVNSLFQIGSKGQSFFAGRALKQRFESGFVNGYFAIFQLFYLIQVIIHTDNLVS